MYHYEQILNEHRQRVARGVQNYDRRRIEAERRAEGVGSEPNSRKVGNEPEASSNGCEAGAEPRIGALSSVR